jgi:hypothetical protein
MHARSTGVPKTITLAKTFERGRKKRAIDQNRYAPCRTLNIRKSLSLARIYVFPNRGIFNRCNRRDVQNRFKTLPNHSITEEEIIRNSPTDKWSIRSTDFDRCLPGIDLARESLKLQRTVLIRRRWKAGRRLLWFVVERLRRKQEKFESNPSAQRRSRWQKE